MMGVSICKSMWWRQFLMVSAVLFVAGFCLSAHEVRGDDCSSYIGDMTINEVYELGNEAWVEVRLLDTSLPSVVYDSWSISLCEKKQGCHTYPVSDGQVLYPESYPEWIRLNVGAQYVNLQNKGGMDIVLWDQDGRAVDYLSVNNYSTQLTNCSSFLYPTATGSLESSPKGIYRKPDGTGPWLELGLPGATGEPTEGYDNDAQTPFPVVPVAEWRFDECGYDGVVAVDSQGAHDATAYNGVISEADGLVGRAAGLTTSNQKFIANSDVPMTSLWTVSVWFQWPYLTSEGSRYHVIGAMAGGGDIMWIDDHNDRWGIWDGTESYDGTYQFSSLSEGWHHMVVVGTREWSGGKWWGHWVERSDLFIDGSLVDSINARSNGNLHYIGTSYDTWLGNQGFRASLDEFLVFDEALDSNEVRDLYDLQVAGRNLDGSLREDILCGAGIDHFEIIHDGSALTCAPESVTVKACADDAEPCTLYTEDVEITLSPTGWSDKDTQTLKSGVGVFRLRHTTPETVNLSVTGEPAAEQALQCVNSGEGNPCALTFYETGFLFELPNLESCQTSSSVDIRAVRMDDETQACTGDDSFALTSRSVSFASSYVSTKIGSEPVFVKGNDDTDFAKLPAIAQLRFDKDAKSSFSFSYKDAGSVTLTASFVDTDGIGLKMAGIDSFVAYPHHLRVSATATDANTSTVFALNNTSSSGDPHWPAGEAFDLEVAGVCDGGSVTPSFAWQTALKAGDILPVGGTSGTFTPDSLAADKFKDGVGSNAVYYSEVGTVILQAVAEGYQEPGIDVTGAATIGRFTPYEFALSWYQTPELAPGCALGFFTYLGQPFGYVVEPIVKVTALNKQEVITANYTDVNWWKITKEKLTSERSYSAFEGTLELSGGGVSYSYPVDEANRGSGLLTYDASSEMKFTRGALTAPFRAAIDLKVNVVDADGISADDPLSFSDIPFTGEASGMNADEMRWGRLAMKNAYGSELLALSMPVRAEYFNGTAFVQNLQDGCTSLDLGQWTLFNGTTTFSGDQTVPVGSGSSTATIYTPVVAGDAGLTFSAPGSNGFIEVSAGLSLLPWLRYDWDGDGSHDDDPTARASFGLYKGRPGMIYMRESFR